ncbi:MAG: AMP-binding protein [Acidobacteriota bacterium]
MAHLRGKKWRIVESSARIEDDAGAWSAAGLHAVADRLATRLAELGVGHGQRVALAATPGRLFVAAQLAVWRRRAVLVPLPLVAPVAAWRLPLELAAARLLLVDATARATLEASSPGGALHGLEVLGLDEMLGDERLEMTPDDEVDAAAGDAACTTETDREAECSCAPDDVAVLLFTSGTTGTPKGVPLRHRQLAAQVASLHRAWAWSADDRILATLPLHHVHGLVNVVLCALAAGAGIRFLPRFDADRVWRALSADVDSELGNDSDGGAITLFMAVPTMYRRLVDAWDAADNTTRARWRAGARRLRLAVSGSAALPHGLFERWREIAGVPPLERYGMTEIGMALSNPLRHTEDGVAGNTRRVAGSVGRPLPGVEVRLVDEDGSVLPPDGEPGRVGEVEVRGPGVFDGYWDAAGRRAPAAGESDALSPDGFFATGDLAVEEGAVVRLLGRRSVDLIKSGGEKISALEIEAVLRDHVQVADVAAVGLPDSEWGEIVAVAVEPISWEDRLDVASDRECGARGTSDLSPSGGRDLPLGGSDHGLVELDQLRTWARARMAPWKLPRRLVVVRELPRNALGKVVKEHVVRLFDGPNFRRAPRDLLRKGTP